MTGPMTYLVTGAVTGDKSESTLHRIKRTYASKGLRVRHCPVFLTSVVPHGLIAGMAIDVLRWPLAICLYGTSPSLRPGGCHLRDGPTFCAPGRVSTLEARQSPSVR